MGRFNADGTFVAMSPDVYRGLLGGDGLGGEYKWAQMPTEPNDDTKAEQTKAIGALCHDAGVAARMMYTAQESRTRLYLGKQALINNFHYENAVFYGTGDGNIGPVLVGMINPNLDEGEFTKNEENSHHVVDARGTDGTAVLDGFTISGGNADGDKNNIQGAGILLFYSKSVISNCRIIGNEPPPNGGIINMGAPGGTNEASRSPGN